MRKADSERVRDAVGALHFRYVATETIAEMLAKDECGIGYPVEISGRQVRNYCQRYRDIHGERPPKDQPDQTVETIDSVIDRIIALVAREVTAFEGKPRGSMTKQRWMVVRDMQNSMVKWEKHRGLRTGERRLNQVPIGDRPSSAPTKPVKETTIQRLAREEREAKTPETVTAPEAVAA